MTMERFVQDLIEGCGEVTALAGCPRESSAGLIALLEGPSVFGATVYVSLLRMDNLDPYGSDHRYT